MAFWRKQTIYSEKELVECTTEIEALLRKYCVKEWLDFFISINQEIRRFWTPTSTSAAKRAILKKLRTLFGGMGSFNDFGLDPRAGHGRAIHLSHIEAYKFNEGLGDLKTRLYKIVSGLEKRI